MLLVAAALVIVLVYSYPSFLGCKVSRDQLEVSQISTFIVPVPEGYAVGFRFNVTNLSDCRLEAELIRVHVLEATFANGTVASPNMSEDERLLTTTEPGQSSEFSYVFDTYFAWKPLKLELRIELTFTDVGTVTVFEGKLDMHE